MVYHNKYATARGWIRSSAAFSVKTGSGDERTLVHRTLGEGLALGGGDDLYTIFRDQTTGLEYIRAERELIEPGCMSSWAPTRRTSSSISARCATTSGVNTATWWLTWAGRACRASTRRCARLSCSRSTHPTATL